MGEYGNRKCVVCGKTFYGYVLRKYCGIECQRVANQEYYRRSKEKERAKRKMEERKASEEKNKGNTIADIAIKAKEAGMSYGKYEAMMEMQRQKDRGDNIESKRLFKTVKEA